MKRGVKITVTGVVQGVGFRPFVHNLALSLGIFGTVRNTGNGVEIYAYGDSVLLDKFIKGVEEQHPPHAHIAEFYVEESQEQFDTFTIVPSEDKSGIVFVPMDLATCPKCSEEIMNVSDRRYNYAFTNCTDCGPRYSIIEELPYDRKFTSMKKFKMCEACQKEYDDSTDRRFHAQPNACPVCGPKVYMNVNGLRYEGVEALDYCAELVNKGEIVVVKGLGGYHIVCDAENDEAILKLRRLKNRPTKPLAIMCNKVADISTSLNKRELEALQSSESPILILKWDHHLSKFINPDKNSVGVMLAYTPLHKLLIERVNSRFIVATSGNLHDEPVIASEEEAVEKLSIYTSFFLHHNRDITNKIDDSVATDAAEQIRLLRRGRGYAPYPVIFKRLDNKKPSILAVGAQLKNTITITKGRYAFVSQYIGDLETVPSIDYFQETYEHMKKLLKTEPEIIVCDMHKGYASTAFAESLSSATGKTLVKLQHHHAHTYAVMAEHNLSDNLISVVMDGTGYGEDGTIWGGEFFLLQKGRIERIYHLDYCSQPGGDSAARYPSRMAQSYLLKAGIWSDFWRERMGMSEKEAELNGNMIKHKLNCIDTSSAGRLFESAGAMAAVVSRNEYEAHAAIALEELAFSCSDLIKQKPYNFSEREGVITTESLIREFSKDIIDNHIEKAAARFHVTFAHIIVKYCEKIFNKSGIRDVGLSGGVFQNKLLLELVYTMLKEKGFNCYVPINVPINDGGISLGQAYYAAIKCEG